MHIYMEPSGEILDTDILAHPVWDKTMLVPVQPMPMSAYFESDEAKLREEDLEGNQHASTV